VAPQGRKKRVTAVKEQKHVTARHSYDLIYLGKRKQGTWSFKLSLEGSHDEMWLVLHQEYKRRRELPWELKRTLRLPLYFDGNSGCVQVGERNKTIEELDLCLPPQPNELGETGADASAGESDQEPDSDQGSIVVFNRAPGSDLSDVESSSSEDDESINIFSAGGSWSGNNGAEHGRQPSAQQHDNIWEFHGLPSPSPPRVVSDLVKIERKGHRLSPYQQAWRRRKASKEL
jgi:hypothetical protein